MFIFRYVGALWRHCSSGEEFLPDAWIQMRYSLCVNCEHFRGGWLRKSCALCACTLSKRRWIFNKLAFPCEECPIGKWSKTV